MQKVLQYMERMMWNLSKAWLWILQNIDIL